MWSWSWVIYVGSGWLINLILTPVLARRYTPEKALGWLTVMFAFPWGGLVLFLIFADNPLGRRRHVRYLEVIHRMKLGERLDELHRFDARDHLNRAWAGIGRLAEACGALPAVEGNAGKIMARTDRIVETLIADIDAAERHVHMVFYIFRDDDVGRAVADALARAVQRGVACRVIADAVGSRPMFDSLGQWMDRQGIEVRPALAVNPLRGRIARIDLRNHRKLVVIDGRVGYIGSWNVARDDFRPRVGPYHDVLLRVAGPIVQELQVLFLEDWSFETREALAEEDLFSKPEPAGQIIAQAVPSGPLYPFAPVRDLAVSAINQARRRVMLTTPYFSPDPALMLSLRLAAQRGARVDVIVPARSDSRFADAAGRAYCKELIDVGVHVHHYQPGILHAKTLTADEDFGMMGSANFDIRSFRLNLEANLLIYSGELVHALRRIQEEYVSNSRPLDRDWWASRPRRRRRYDECAKLVGPLL